MPYWTVCIYILSEDEFLQFYSNILQFVPVSKLTIQNNGYDNGFGTTGKNDCLSYCCLGSTCGVIFTEYGAVSHLTDQFFGMPWVMP